MQHTRIKILILVIVFLTLGRCFSQNQQVLRNGYVAATNQGIYYLQDGTDEWLNFNIDASGSGYLDYDHDLDSITTISHDGTNLIFGGSGFYRKYRYSAKILGTINGYLYNNQFNYFFYPPHDHDDYDFKPHFITNKFKSDYNVFSIYKPYNIQSYAYVLNNNAVIRPTGSSAIIDAEITGICSDNDSIVVVVGPNNKLAKITCSNNFTSMTVSWVTGLTSETTNKHKVCYDQIRDLFYIISCDDVYRDFNIYSYNKSTITQITNSIALADTIFNLISGEGVFNDNMYAIGKDTYGGEIKILFFNKVTGASNSARIIWTGENDVFHGDLVFNRQTNEIGFGAKNLFKILYTDGLTVKTINLPSGVIIYDLEYINYLE